MDISVDTDKTKKIEKTLPFSILPDDIYITSDEMKEVLDQTKFIFENSLDKQPLKGPITIDLGKSKTLSISNIKYSKK